MVDRGSITGSEVSVVDDRTMVDRVVVVWEVVGSSVVSEVVVVGSVASVASLEEETSVRPRLKSISLCSPRRSSLSDDDDDVTVVDDDVVGCHGLAVVSSDVVVAIVVEVDEVGGCCHGFSVADVDDDVVVNLDSGDGCGDDPPEFRANSLSA